MSLPETIKAAEFFLADGIILTGKATGEETSVKDLAGKFLYVLRFYRGYLIGEKNALQYSDLLCKRCLELVIWIFDLNDITLGDYTFFVYLFSFKISSNFSSGERERFG